MTLDPPSPRGSVPAHFVAYPPTSPLQEPEEEEEGEDDSER